METMLRRLSLLLALLIALAGCAAAEEVPNPRVEMADASELEAALGFPVNAPEGVDAVYTVIGGSTGEAAFDVGDIACTLRAARTQDDISGLFMEMSDPVEEERAAGEGVVSVAFRSTEETAAMTFTPGSWTTCSIAWYSTARRASWLLARYSTACSPPAPRRSMNDAHPGRSRGKIHKKG